MELIYTKDGRPLKASQVHGGLDCDLRIIHRGGCPGSPHKALPEYLICGHCGSHDLQRR